MEKLSKIKSLIALINKSCDNENLSIAQVLERMNLNVFSFFSMMLDDSRLLDEEVIAYLTGVINISDARFGFSSNVDLEHDELEIYSKMEHISVGILKNVIRINTSKSWSDEGFTYFEEESFSARIERFLEHIHYEVLTTTSNDQLEKRTVTHKYPLKHIRLGVTYSIEEQQDAFEVTINEDFLQSDLETIKRSLDNFNYFPARIFLEEYPTPMKVVSKEPSLNNFKIR